MNILNLSDAVVVCSNISDPWQAAICKRCGFTLSLDDQDLLGAYHKLKPMFDTFAFLLSLLSLTGNFLVILTVLADRHTDNRSMADLFLFNVAIVDLFYSGLNFIGDSLFLVQGVIRLQETCVSQPLTSLRLLVFTVSMYSFLAQSIERYLVATTLFVNINNLKVTMLFLLWLVSLAVTLPISFCEFIVNVPYTVCLSIITLFLPLLVILVVNFHICKSTRNQVGPRPNRGEVRSSKPVSLVIALVVSLVVLWMPYLVMLVYPAVFGTVSSCGEYLRVLLVKRAFNILAYVNPVINPVLYCLLSKNFRQGFKSMHRFLCPCFFEPA